MGEDGKLSQAEIDALLSGSPSTDEPASDVALSAEDKDALGEIGNISFGSAATVLSTLLQQRVEITTPTVSLIQASDVNTAFARPYVLVAVEYTAGVEGSNALAIELNDAKTIADLMLGGDGTNTQGDLNELHLSAVAEAMNQMMGGAATSLSSMFQRHINISPPKVEVVDLGSLEQNEIGLSGWIVNISFRLRVGTLIDSTIMQLTPYEFARDMVQAFVEQFINPPQTSAPPVQAPVHTQPEPIGMSMSTVGGSTAPAPKAAAAYAQQATVASSTAAVAASAPPRAMQVVQQPEYADFSAEASTVPAPRNLSLLFDVSLNVTVELGRTRRPIKEILDLAPGSIVELDKLAGEPVDILVNNKRIAVGEVVVIDENFGVRVTDILAPAERLRNLES